MKAKKLLYYLVVTNFIIGLVLMKFLGFYKGGVMFSSNLHYYTYFTFLWANVLWFFLCLLLSPFKNIVKIILFPVLTFVSLLGARFLLVFLLKPVLTGFKLFRWFYNDWDWSIAWMEFFCMSSLLFLFWVILERYSILIKSKLR
jgi:hypothetical protein